jgi:hypothetical protein
MAAGEPIPMPGWRRFITRPRASTLVAVALLVLGAALRLAVGARNIETPMIDENEVVEQAVAFMGGDLHQYFLKYGPLTMYVLAGIYRVAAFLHGVTPLEYASRVFFEGTEHYLIARYYVLGWLSVLAAASFFSLRGKLGVGPALLVMCLFGFPFLELLAPGARIDLPQAAFQGLALLCLYEVVGAPSRLGVWALGGAFAGLAIATKPLPGLLVVPTFVLAAWLGAGSRADGSPRSLVSRLAASLTGRGLWVAALACVVCAVLGNPAMLDLGSFVTSQRNAVLLHSGQDVNWSHESIGASLLRLGWPFVLVLLTGSALAVVSALAPRDRRALLPASFFLVYVAAFYGRASRAYYVVAAAAAACLLIGHGLAFATDLVRRRWGSRSRQRALARVGGFAWLPLAAACILPPLGAWWVRSFTPNPAFEAERWIVEHVPAGSKLFYVGWRAAGPRLVATNAKVQAKWGDHFEYERNRYVFLKRAFDLGFASYEKSGKPRYALSVHDAVPYPRQSKRTPASISDGLVKQAQAKRIGYIILVGYKAPSWQALGYPWFGAAKQVAEFGKTVIFQVPAAPAASPNPATGAQAQLPAPATPAPPSSTAAVRAGQSAPEP